MRRRLRLFSRCGVRSLLLIIRLFFWLLALAVIAVAILIGVANRAPVEFSLLPVPFSLTVPLCLVVFTSVFLGLLLGWAVAQASAFLKRRRAADAARAVDVALKR